MILTDRELFLLIICTVFYITLFIVVLQSNRRKMQLLQSRLDNIHAMQKIAVMEQRTHAQDVNDIFSSDVYQRIKQYLADGKNMPEAEWAELTHCLDAQPTLSEGFRPQGLDKRLGRLCTVYIK